MSAPQWKAVVGYEDLYEVSDAGAVRSIRSGRLLSPYVSGSGYEAVHLYGRGERCVKSVHCIVLEAFVGCAPGKQGNHKNAIKTDNRLANLEWVSPKENIAHARNIGRLTGPKRPASGERNGSAKLTAGDVAAIRAAKGSARQVDLADRFGITQGMVSQIQRGSAWRVS